MPLAADVIEALRQSGQSHVITHSESLSPTEVDALEAQLRTLVDGGVPLFKALPSLRARLTASLEPPAESPPDPPSAANMVALDAQDPRCRALDPAEVMRAGESLLRGGHGAVVLMAGGSGVRLGLPYPKGLFVPPQLSYEATLFDFHFLRLAALQRQMGAPIPVAVMTSLENNAATVEYLVQHAYFGLEPDRVIVFCQAQLPAFTADGRLVLKTPTSLAWGPSGNGSLYSSLAVSGTLERFAAWGVTYVQIVAVDNLLCPIADVAQFGVAVCTHADVVPYWSPKRSDDESVGVFAYRHGRLGAVEYTELGPLAAVKGSDGQRLFDCGNVGIFVLSLDMLKRAATIPLRLHAARKAVPTTVMEDEGTHGTTKAIKLEAFIFDAFEMVDPHRSTLLKCRREDIFAPIKNASGAVNVDNPDTAVSLLRQQHTKWVLQALRAAVANGNDGTAQRTLTAAESKELLFDIPPTVATDKESTASAVRHGMAGLANAVESAAPGATVTLRA